MNEMKYFSKCKKNFLVPGTATLDFYVTSVMFLLSPEEACGFSGLSIKFCHDPFSGPQAV